MVKRILVCTDLDRTLLPNGSQPESPAARTVFSRVCARADITLAYVTGRDRGLVMSAIREYELPVPDYVIGDVGTSIYTVVDHQWQPWLEWWDEIADSWQGLGGEQLASWLVGLKALRLQEAAKQNTYKLSYYTPGTIETESLLEAVRSRLAEHNTEASLIWSLDESTGTGLLDILPIGANKQHAIEFLMSARGFTLESTLFAGDSGNDLPVLTSPIRSVLVANASDPVRNEAKRRAQQQGTLEALYLAKGGAFGMNGNYSAGVLEGLAHYFPQSVAWIQGAMQQ